MKSRLLPLYLAALLTGAGGLAVADDGAINNKNMTNTINLPTFSQDIVNNAVPEAEHAFTEMMKFYVPAQAASGESLTDSYVIEYNNIDDLPVETLTVAKPLVNVFMYGPLFEPEGTAFAHTFADAYASVSLDDGVTWKEVNLSESGDLSSFNLDTDHVVKDDPLPSDHIILLGGNNGALHAPGYETPYTSECTECHGVALQGTSQAPSCYSCHGDKWDEDVPTELGPVITSATLEDGDTRDTLRVKVENAESKVVVSLINAVSGEVIATKRSGGAGKVNFDIKLRNELAPCVVLAQYTDADGIVVKGAAVTVVDKETGEPLEECEGSPLDLTNYPGGVFNVFHAVAKDKVTGSTNGNKVLVAWPSRFCEQGQPAYSMTTDNADETQQARLDAIVGFIQTGDTEELGVPGLPDFNMEDDLYLVDAFGVAGSQGSIDFADEGYPQAGVVPFGCVWTARGILLPGDDPRTAETEATHFVWTKAERLTSGRRDPNRIEVAAVKGAGFVVTWQEDPDGLRPGQGEGPGEGWSGAVAHPQTDVWYSFINDEYFDLVEDPADTTNPMSALQYTEDGLLATASGRPQVFVPMAVPMRLTNNAKCNAPVDGVITDDLYCDFDLAEIYGLKDQCADTIDIDTGSPSNPKVTTICVADSDGDGDADLPNRANTASTRPRLDLQGYDASADDLSAWVIMAVEESKGLGKFFFEADSDGDGYAQPCVEGSTLTCAEEIGKNAWYHSFDMGTPDTSAGIGQPNSLVENLVYQGDLLNQPEVYWNSGEWYGRLSTADFYPEYAYDVVSTEIARRTSLLVQTIDKALNSQVGLVATPSWKQGSMRQGGPADTFLRRFVLPEGYGDEEPVECPIVEDAATPIITSAVYGFADCPIDQNVDAEQPVILTANYVVTATSSRIYITGTGADTRILTPLAIQNAVTDSRIATILAPATSFSGSFFVPRTAVPCAIQAADADLTPAFGPWIAVANAPATCIGPIPPACLTDIPVVHIEGTDSDRITSTLVQVRNAVSGTDFGAGADLAAGTFAFDIPAPSNPPCAVQAADADGSLEYGPWIAVDTSAFPDLACADPIPDACLTTDGAPVATAAVAAAAATTEGIDVNPYGFENMVCETYYIEPDTNPYYPKGVCADTPTNLSAVVPDTCIDDGDGSTVVCPTVDFTDSTFGILTVTGYPYGPYLNGVEQNVGDQTRVLTWHQCPSGGEQTVGDFTAVTCDNDAREDGSNLQDQSWYNPLDISKGHRGFIDGDFVMFLYAWSPNWRLNAKGSDRYELYIRRSFTGGEDWTVTPASFTASNGVGYTGDGTVTCETYRSETTQTGETVPPKVCYRYDAGDAEQARNVTQHKSNNITTLDPRYAPTPGTIKDGCTDGLFPTAEDGTSVIDGIFTCDDGSETSELITDSDLRNPSRYFVVFEVGDNKTVVDGEAEPLDLFYSRAEGFGDNYVVWTETDTETPDDLVTVCYPSEDYGVLDLGVVVGSGFCNEFDNLNTRSDTHSSEAALRANPDGSKMYGVWAQWVFEGDKDNYDGEIVESDAMARRVWWIDDYRSLTEAYTLPGTQQQ